MSLPNASHSGESCQFLNNKSPSALPQTSVSNHVLTPCHGQGDCPCHSCLPSHSSGGQVIRDFSADSASHLDQGDCSSDLETTSSECMVYATLPKTAVILFFSQRQTLHSIYPLHPPVAVNPLLHPMMDTDLSPSSYPCGDFCPTPVSSGRHQFTSFCNSPRASSVWSKPRAVLPGPFASHLYQCPMVWSCVNVCFV